VSCICVACHVALLCVNKLHLRLCVCNITVEEVKAKWKNLRDTYTRKKRLEQDGSRSGRAAKKKKQWKYMRVMDFLDPSTEHRRYSSVFCMKPVLHLQLYYYIIVCLKSFPFIPLNVQYS